MISSRQALKHVVTRVRNNRWPEVLLTSTHNPDTFMRRCCIVEAHGRGRFLVSASMNYGAAHNDGKQAAAILRIQGTASHCSFHVDTVNGHSALRNVLAWAWHVLHPSGQSYAAVAAHMSAHGMAASWTAFSAAALRLLQRDGASLPAPYNKTFALTFGQ